MRYLEFPEGTFDGLWSSFSLLHIRANEIEKTLSGFKSVLRQGGLFFAALHQGPKTDWVKTTISGMERDTYVQEWIQTEIEDAVRSSGFTILQAALSFEPVDVIRCSAFWRKREPRYRLSQGKRPKVIAAAAGRSGSAANRRRRKIATQLPASLIP